MLLLLERGYAVIGIGSRKESVAKAMAMIGDRHPDSDCIMLAADLSSLKETKATCERIAKLLDADHSGRLTALINNAGGVRLHFSLTGEGLETQFALNHLSGFLMSFLLLKYLKDGKIIFTTSRSHRWMKIYWHDLMLEKSYNLLKAYKQTKLANVMTAQAFRKHFASRGVVAYAVDPGLVRTDIGNKHLSGLAEWIWNWRKRKGADPAVPAKTYLYLLESDDALGLVYKDSREIPHNRHADRDEEVERLFLTSAKLVGIDPNDYQ